MNQLRETQYRWIVEYLEGLEKLGIKHHPRAIAKEVVDNMERLELEDMVRHFHGDEVEKAPF